MTAIIYGEDDPYTPVGHQDEIALDVEAINAQGERRIFKVRDYGKEYLGYFSSCLVRARTMERLLIKLNMYGRWYRP